MKKIIMAIKTPLLISVVFLFLCGIAYPLVMTGISQVLFPNQANGSLLKVNNKVVGSKQIGQAFTGAQYLKGRPSAVNYNTYTAAEKQNGSYSGVASGSANLAPTNPKLKERVQKDLTAFLAKNPTIKKSEIPTDLLTASGSGLDPHISYQAALIQLPAMAKASGLSENELKQLVDEQTQPKLAGVFGETTVNVLAVNLQIAQQLKQR